MSMRASGWSTSAAIAGACACALVACGEAPESALAKQDLRATPEEVSPLAVPDDATPEQIVPLQAKRVAAGFVAEGPLVKGTLAQGARSDHLLVLKAGHCYRVVGAAEATVTDMDLFLYDPDGVQTHQDPGEDRFPVLGKQTEICPQQGGAYRVQVHMFEGGGAFAFGLYQSP
jgi:hypothetical protein